MSSKGEEQTQLQRTQIPEPRRRPPPPPPKPRKSVPSNILRSNVESRCSLSSSRVRRSSHTIRSKYLINDIPRGTSGVKLFNFLVSPPHWRGKIGGPPERQPQVQFSCTVTDSRLDDELSVAVLEFTDTPNWLQLANLDPHGFPKKTDLGTLWKGVNMVERDEKGQTAFIRAVIDDNAIYTETLAEFGDTDVNAQDHMGRTALHWACVKGLPDMARLCLSVPECNVALRDQDDLTAFDIARKGDDELIPNLFYASILEMDTRDPRGALLRVLTVSSRPPEDLPIFPGEAMFQPIEDRDPALVVALISRGVDLSARNRNGDTALHLAAAQTNNADIVRRLLEAGSDIDAIGAGGSTPLHCAARVSDRETVKVFLQWNLDLEVKDSNGKTALDVAAQNGQHDIARLLVNYNPDTITRETPRLTSLRMAMGTATAPPPMEVIEDEIENERAVIPSPLVAIQWGGYAGPNALLQAVLDGNLEAVVALLKAGADVEFKDSMGRTALHLAAVDGHTEIIKVLLAKGANTESLAGDRRTALHYAASSGHPEIVAELLGKGANINAADKDGWTPLYWAASKGESGAVVGVLLDNGATTAAANQKRWTALHKAASRGHAELVTVLLEKGADIDAADKDGLTALHTAANGGHAEVATVLMEKGANIDAAEKHGRTALHSAAKQGLAKVATSLLAAGANFEAADVKGVTALHFAADSGDAEIVMALLALGANIGGVDKDGLTALHRAAGEGNAEVATVLLANGANIEGVDKEGLTALHWAASEGHGEVVTALLAKGANIEARSRKGTPLQVARRSRHTLVAEILAVHGAQTTKLGRFQHTVLQTLRRIPTGLKEGTVLESENESSVE